MLQVAPGKWRPPIVAVSIIALAVIAALVIGYLGILSAEDRAVEKGIIRIHQLISVGMDIDESVAKLKEAGFRVGEKHNPTAADDYYQVNVPLRRSIPRLETIRYVLGMKEGKKKVYVVITANGEGAITAID